MPADASIDLELNAKQLYSELQVAERKYTQGMDRIGQSTNRTGGAMDGIKVKTKAAGRQIHNFADDMAHGADAATLLQDAVMGVGKSLGLSLGALAGVMVGAVAVDKIHEVIKEYQALNTEVDKLTAPRAAANFQSLTDLEAHLTATAAAMEKLREQGGGKESGFGWLNDMFRAWSGGTPKPGESMYQMVKRMRSERLTAGGESTDRDRGDMAEKFQQRMRDREGALGGESDFITKAKALQRASDEKKHDTQEAVVELMKELDLTFRELAAAVAAKRRDRVQQTLGELAAIPSQSVVGDGADYDRWETGNKARAAQQWDAYGESRRMAGDMSGAQDAFNYSSDIKRSIPGLKDSEKDLKSEFKGALDESKVLQDIRDGVRKPPVNR
jgi:hypothetical protein